MNYKSDSHLCKTDFKLVEVSVFYMNSFRPDLFSVKCYCTKTLRQSNESSYGYLPPFPSLPPLGNSNITCWVPVKGS